MYKINIFMILLLLLSTSVTSNEFEKMKKVNKDFIKSSTILYDQILLVYNTVKRKEINSKEEVNENEVRLNNSHFLVNLTSTINLNQIYSKASLKKNVIVNIKDLHFFVHENNLNAVATLDKFHSNNKFMPINHWYLGLFTISLDKESWNIKNNAFGYYANTYSGKSISKVGDMLYIYGGWSLDLDTSISRLSNNFTVFDLTNNNTFRYGVEVDSNMPPNAFHTATMINSTTMVILGGVPYEKLNEINPGSEYNPNNASYSKELTVSKLKYIYIYNTAAERYMKVKTKDYDDRVRMGHSATYLSDMNCILVYGGTDKVNNYTILYNDIQLLNLTDWKWTKIIIKDFNDEVFNVGRAWHSNELINNKVVFFYGDINYYNYNYNYDIIVIDLESLNLEKKTIKLSDTIGPAIKRENEDFSQLYTSNEYLKYNLDTSRYNLYSSFSGSEIAGIVFGLASFFIISAILLNYSRNKYKRWKWFRKYSSIELTLRPTFLSSLNLSLPNTKNGDEYGIWEMNSIYTNSVHSFEAEFSHYNEAIVLCRCNNTAASTNKTTKVNLNREITEFNIDSITNNITVNSTNNFK